MDLNFFAALIDLVFQDLSEAIQAIDMATIDQSEGQRIAPVPGFGVVEVANFRCLGLHVDNLQSDIGLASFLTILACPWFQKFLEGSKIKSPKAFWLFGATSLILFRKIQVVMSAPIKRTLRALITRDWAMDCPCHSKTSPGLKPLPVIYW